MGKPLQSSSEKITTLTNFKTQLENKTKIKAQNFFFLSETIRDNVLLRCIYILVQEQEILKHKDGCKMEIISNHVELIMNDKSQFAGDRIHKEKEYHLASTQITSK